MATQDPPLWLAGIVYLRRAGVKHAWKRPSAYEGDPVGRLGYLHVKRWTREQAIQWFATTNGSSEEEVRGEVDRYCAWPGQACGYKVGHSEINRLRAKAQQALGPRYDFRRFNDAVVTTGGVPMVVLARRIDAFIRQQQET